MMTDHSAIRQRIEEVRDFDALATSGPWEADIVDGISQHFSVDAASDVISLGGSDSWGGCDHRLSYTNEDALAIAAFRSLAPALAEDAAALLEELDALHSWSGLISLLDEHYPADVFDGSSGDPGPRIVALIREVDQLRQDNRKLIGAVKLVSKLHCLDLPFPANSFNGCGVCIPCNAAKVLSEVEANVGPYQPHNMGDS